MGAPHASIDLVLDASFQYLNGNTSDWTVPVDFPALWAGWDPGHLLNPLSNAKNVITEWRQRMVHRRGLGIEPCYK